MTTTTTFQPTPEQRVALDLFATGNDLVIEAGAGTGKTSTLLLLANLTPRTGAYIAFNKAIVEEAKRKMPRTVTAGTAHSFAFRAVGAQMRHRLNGPRVKSNEVAKLLKIEPLDIIQPNGRKKRLAAGFLGGLVQRAVIQFCQSADLVIDRRHVPYQDGIDAALADGRRGYANNNAVAAHLAPYLTRAWADVTSPEGRLPYRHDHYLKAWQLAGPVIPCDYIMFDEAQDANPVMRAIVEAQRHAQIVYVGDSQQQIYSFSGAVNALAEVDGERTFLSRSFRFGPQVAAAANGILEMLDAELRIEGAGPRGTVGHVDNPEVILTRTNAEGVRLAMDELRVGGRPAIVGGADDVTRFAQAAIDLKANGWTPHPDLTCFASWGEVQEYVEDDPNGSELALLVNLIDDFGADVIVGSLGSCVAESDATRVFSTAHKAKGREWDRVRLGGDFPTGFGKDGKECDVPAEELRLLYVAVTRARLALDPNDNPLVVASQKPQGARTSPIEEVTAGTRVTIDHADCEFGCAHTGTLASRTAFGGPASDRVRVMVKVVGGREEMAIVKAGTRVVVGSGAVPADLAPAGTS